MKILKIDNISPEIRKLQEAANLLKQNKVIIHPTETVYGLAGNYANEQVIENIQEIKGRGSNHPFSILVNNIDTIIEISGNKSNWLTNFLSRVLPDAVTVLVPRKRIIANSFWNQFPYIGFRYPDHFISIALVNLSGTPLITTSANLTGEKPPASLNDINSSLLNRVNLVLDAGETFYKKPSTIIKVIENKPGIELIREGAISFEKIKNCLEI
jgi:L-threonylcarbamoyladenylate synthase